MNRKIGVILSYILMIFEVMSTLLLTPFIIRTLGQAEYGVYKLAAAINAYLLLLDLGVGNAVTRYIAKYRVAGEKVQEQKFFGVATIFYLVIAVITVIIGMIIVRIFPSAFAKGLSTEEARLGQKLLSITMINSAVTLGSTAYMNVLIAYEKFSISKGGSIIQIVLRMILTFVILKLGIGAVGIVTVHLLLTICYRGFTIFYVIRIIKLKPVFRGVESTFVKETVTYSSLILIQMIATQLNASVDHVLIGALVASSSVILAVYGVGTQIVQYFQSIGSAFTGVLMPGIVKMVESKASVERITDEMVRIGRLIFMVLALIWGGFFVCGKHFVVLWAGEENEQAYIVTMILMTAYIFILTESIGNQILWAMNEHKEQAILKIAIVLLNIILTVFLIKWNPLIGATIGTFISLMCGDVGVMNVIFKRRLKMDLLYYYKGLFKGIVPSLLISIVVGMLVSYELPLGWFYFVCEVVLMVIVYALGMLLFGMSQYEKNLALSVLHRVRRG